MLTIDAKQPNVRVRLGLIKRWHATKMLNKGKQIFLAYTQSLYS